MIKISIILTFQVLISCQELVVQNYTGSNSDGEQSFRTYQKPEWNNIQDVAVYGWFKIKSSYSYSGWPLIFQLTQNDGFTGTGSVKVGDRVLCLYLYASTQVVPATYTQSTANVQSTISFTAADKDVWNFFYYSYGSVSKKAFLYVKFYSSGEKTCFLSNVIHYNSNFYRIHVGNVSAGAYFPGSLYNIFIKFGNDAYKENDFQSLMVYNPNNAASVMPSDISSKLIISYNSQGADIIFTLKC